MTLVERLEALAKQKSRRLGEQLVQGGYRVDMADERDLLEEAAKQLRTFAEPPMMFVPEDFEIVGDMFVRKGGYIENG